MTPRLHFFVPGLIPPPEADGLDWLRPPDTPLLDRWLRGQAAPSTLGDPAALAHTRLCPGSAPSAATAWQAECRQNPALAVKNTEIPAGSTLACLSPIHLQAGIDTAVVMGERFLALSSAERHALTADLAPWLAADGLILLTATPQRWYLAIPAGSPLGDGDLPPLGEALNRSAHGLIDGADRRGIRRWLTELQMWLYAHPINTARAERGQPELNSLWLWGRNAYSPAPPTPRPDAPNLLTDLPSLAGCWPGTATLIEEFPTHPEQIAPPERRAAGAGGNTIICWSQPAYAALEGDFAGWQQALSTLEQGLQNLPTRALTHATLDTGHGARSFPHWRNVWGILQSR